VRRHKKGFTLIEVLVVAAILSAITLAMVTIFTQSTRSFNITSSKLVLQQKARDTIRRINPMLVTAARSGAAPSAIVYPQDSTATQERDRIVFTTSEDFLVEPGPLTRSSRWTSVQDQRFTYQLGLDPRGQTNVWLTKGTFAGTTFTALLPNDTTLFPAPWLEYNSTVSRAAGNPIPRRIVSGENNRALLADLRFDPLLFNGVRLRVTVVGPRFQQATVAGTAASGKTNLVERYRSLAGIEPVSTPTAANMAAIQREFDVYVGESLIQLPAVNP
jgi:prepilin-type N-terminal cleavage/methylation domain-containing protein